jgi:hypothetical protein
MTRSRLATTIFTLALITSPVWIGLLMWLAWIWISTVGMLLVLATCIATLWALLTGHFTSERMT